MMPVTRSVTLTRGATTESFGTFIGNKQDTSLPSRQRYCSDYHEWLFTQALAGLFPRAVRNRRIEIR